MILLALFAFVAGIVTILSPCILPILPIMLSSTSNSKGNGKPYGVVLGFVLSFTFFTLFLSSIVQLTGLSANTLRNFSIFVLMAFGISIIFPKFQVGVEKLLARFVGRVPKVGQHTGFLGGMIVGLSLGLLWTPCVGPILASVISLAITGSVSIQAFVITLAYSLGTSLPMFAIIIMGSGLMKKIPWLIKNTGNIQKTFGLVMIATSLALYFGLDRSFQSFVLEKFPNYGSILTRIDDNKLVENALNSSRMMNPNTKPVNNGDSVYPKAPELIGGGDWHNTNGNTITLEEKNGSVVLIDFWTYTCVNCQRTLPYLKKWHAKYADKGLVIVGIHSPEFEFEKDSKNVAQAIKDFDIRYPVVQDNKFEIWRAYNNRFWPAKYIIDKNGRIRYTHFGEGQYSETERMIVELLAESGVTGLRSVDEVELAQNYSKTPETYLGYERVDRFASDKNILYDKIELYKDPKSLLKNHFSVDGDAIFTKEFLNPLVGTQLTLRYEAKDVFLVARSKSGSSVVRITVKDRKGKIMYSNRSKIIINKDSLYKLTDNKMPPGEYSLTIEFEDSDAEIFAFTFG
jgi:cytochrome c biogenesis protein CcdA/thiol-disulfide isomerase/thioredoxin